MDTWVQGLPKWLVSRAAGQAVAVEHGPAARHILVVEDEPHVSALLADTLLDHGYAVTAIDSALGTLDLARQLRPCAILLDLGLPYRSGALLLADLKADPATAHIPVIIVSALTELLAPDRRVLAAAVIAKPFETPALIDALRQTCG